MKYLLLALAWILYCAIHSYLISTGLTKKMSLLLKDGYRFYRLFYVILSTLLILPIFYLSAQLNDKVIITYIPPWSYIRIALSSLSILVFFWAFLIDYDVLSFIGIRQIFDSGKKSTSISGEGIRKDGLLGIVRHPMYFAVLILIWCQTFRMSDIMVNTILTAYIFIGTMLEEKKLILEFGESYIQYQHEVPMLIPFLKFKKAGKNN
jgi:protein-S-isoprenylcysteine O-methyltransferase Ste14